MPCRRIIDHPLRLGLIVGLVFGSVNLVLAWLKPLADDTPGALLRFYGPMFFIWGLASFRQARSRRQVLSSVTTGVIVAFATFCVLDALVLLRVNLFLNELTGREDWQNMMSRFHDSGGDSLGWFVNMDYIKGLPVKTSVAAAIGGVMGTIGGIAGRFVNTRRSSRPNQPLQPTSGGTIEGE
jgi:hypothetical protein